jgi:hypothetical protein
MQCAGTEQTVYWSVEDSRAWQVLAQHELPWPIQSTYLRRPVRSVKISPLVSLSVA